MQEKTVELKSKIKKVWDKHKYNVVIVGSIIGAMCISREVGYAQGYITCLNHVVDAASKSAGID